MTGSFSSVLMYYKTNEDYYLTRGEAQVPGTRDTEGTQRLALVCWETLSA